MPVGVADDLHVAAVDVMLAGEPQVVAGVGVVHAAAVGANEGAVDGHVGPAGGLAGREHLVQVGGVGGEHVDAFVQVPVAGGHRDGEVAGEDLHVGVVAEPPQHKDRLVSGGGGAGADAGAAAAAFDDE